MNWCFAIVNNKLVEIFFEKNKGKIEFLGHCYIKESEYKSKKEKLWIKQDTVKARFVYRKGRYKRIEPRSL